MSYARPFNAIDRILRAGLQRHERNLGTQTFTWKGVEIPCVPSNERRGIRLEIGGWVREVALSLLVRRELFPTADLSTITADADDWTADSEKPNPTAGRKLTFRGRIWRIITVTESPDRSHWIVDLDAPEQ